MRFARYAATVADDQELADDASPPPGVSPDLPPGFDDPGGPWFVPPELRAAYAADEAGELRDVADGPALQWLRATALAQAYGQILETGTWPQAARQIMLGADPAAPTHSQMSQIVAAAGVTLPDRLTPPDVATYVHQRRLHEAAQRARHAAQEITRRTAWDRSHLCDCCHQTRRDVARQDIRTVPGQVLLCGPCADVIRQQVLAELAAEQVEGQPRGALAARWLTYRLPEDPAAAAAGPDSVDLVGGLAVTLAQAAR